MTFIEINMKKTAILIAFLSSNAFADDLAPLSIFGGQQESEIAGSSSYIDDVELKKSGYTDTERIMGRVPGVFSQTEDGLGLRTNIGMRGTNPNRTTKINITEDGILQGPAVYSNPSMYFFQSCINPFIMLTYSKKTLSSLTPPPSWSIL